MTGRYLDSIYFDRTVVSIQSRDDVRHSRSRSMTRSMASQQGEYDLNSIASNTSPPSVSTGSVLSSRFVMSRGSRGGSGAGRNSV
jgi:hypothetical protein